jgi:hypothetical protein
MADMLSMIAMKPDVLELELEKRIEPFWVLGNLRR